MSAAKRIEPVAPRELYVLEMCDANGFWFPLCGDSYLDLEDAEDAQRACLQVTRIAVYKPVTP